jgi:hypothetical protein
MASDSAHLITSLHRDGLSLELKGSDEVFAHDRVGNLARLVPPTFAPGALHLIRATASRRCL